MVISELALGLFTSFLYDSFKNIPKEIFDTSSEVYDKAIEEFSNENYKLTGIQIEMFFRRKNVEKAIKRYLKSPDKLDCSNILINEFFELFSEKDFSHEDADLILNTFFEIIDAEIEKYPELIIFFDHYLAKQTYQTVQEMHKEISGNRENQDKKESGVDFKESLEKYLNKIIDEDGKTEISEVLYRTFSQRSFTNILSNFPMRKAI